MAWKDRNATYAKKVYVDHEVRGEKLRFYPNRIGVLGDLAEVSRHLARAMTVLFSNDREDTAAVTERYREGAADVERTTVEAISPELAAERLRQKREAVDELVDAFGDPRTCMALGRCLMDSLRDEFEFRKDRGPAEVEEFLYGGEQGGIDAAMLAEMVQGWIRANSRVFGDVGERMAGLVRAKVDALRAEPPSGSPSEETKPADGSSFKMPSSQPWGQVSDSSSSSPSI